MAQGRIYPQIHTLSTGFRCHPQPYTGAVEPANVTDVASRYRRFAAHEAKRHSDIYMTWAKSVADDPEIVALISAMPPRLRQPNLVFAAARMVGAQPGPYSNLRTTLRESLDAVVSTARTHYVQTNEAARMAVLLPALARVREPVALIELGTSAGLCLYPDRWAYRYVNRSGDVLAQMTPDDPIGTLTCVVKGAVPLPTRIPRIVHRQGIDSHPLDPDNEADRAWLRMLVWPGQDERLARLDAALDHARSHRVPIYPGDITHHYLIGNALSRCPEGSRPVIFHSATMAYLDDGPRAALETHLRWLVNRDLCDWISNEGVAVVAGIRQALADEPTRERDLRKGSFVVALNGEPLYQADGHAAWIL